MSKYFSQTFSLDTEIVQFIEEQRFLYKKNRSTIIKAILRYYIKNPEKLRLLLEDYDNDSSK